MCRHLPFRPAPPAFRRRPALSPLSSNPSWSVFHPFPCSPGSILPTPCFSSACVLHIPFPEPHSPAFRLPPLFLFSQQPPGSMNQCSCALMLFSAGRPVPAALFYPLCAIRTISSAASRLCESMLFSAGRPAPPHCFIPYVPSAQSPRRAARNPCPPRQPPGAAGKWASFPAGYWPPGSRSPHPRS